MGNERTSRRERPPRVAMPIDEAQRIAENASNGLLDMADPDVARVVAQANRVVVRSQVWGAAQEPKARRWRRLTVVGAIVFIAVWVAGLLVPLFISLH
jgi:hypothetical protein